MCVCSLCLIAIWSLNHKVGIKPLDLISSHLIRNKETYKKLIRRWDSERELSLRRHRTRTTKYNRLVHKFRHRSTRLCARMQVYQIQWNNVMQWLLRRSRSFKVTDFEFTFAKNKVDKMFYSKITSLSTTTTTNLFSFFHFMLKHSTEHRRPSWNAQHVHGAPEIWEKYIVATSCRIIVQHI